MLLIYEVGGDTVAVSLPVVIAYTAAVSVPLVTADTARWLGGEGLPPPQFIPMQLMGKGVQLILSPPITPILLPVPIIDDAITTARCTILLEPRIWLEKATRLEFKKVHACLKWTSDGQQPSSEMNVPMTSAPPTPPTKFNLFTWLWLKLRCFRWSCIDFH